MKYIFILCCFVTTVMTAQTTQPTIKTMDKSVSQKTLAKQPALTPKSKKAAMDANKKSKAAASNPAFHAKDANLPSNMVSPDDVERMAKYGLAVSEKNALGGLIEGSKAPNFKAKDQNGNTIELKELLKEGKVVVVFYRGYWCGICNRALAEFETELKSITDKGAKVITITTESNESAKNTIEKNDITFSVISDTDGKIARDYRVLYEVSEEYQNKIINYTKSSIQKYNNSDAALLPVPATYIIDQEGNISWHQYSIDYSDRATVEEIVKEL